MKTIIIEDVEYTATDEQKGKLLSKIIIPKGWRLWTYEECVKLHNNISWRKKLNLKNCWFFINDIFELNKDNGYVMRFFANSDWASLDCDKYPTIVDSGLGVRFARTKNKGILK